MKKSNQKKMSKDDEKLVKMFQKDAKTLVLHIRKFVRKYGNEEKLARKVPVMADEDGEVEKEVPFDAYATMNAMDFIVKQMSEDDKASERKDISYIG